MKPVRKAVLPVAGFGTRVLPATKAVPKEMLTVFDRPAIQYVVDEARAAGIEHIVFITGRNKAVIEDYFDRAFELEASLTDVYLQYQDPVLEVFDISQAGSARYHVLMLRGIAIDERYGLQIVNNDASMRYYGFSAEQRPWVEQVVAAVNARRGG